jgi:hypothetical protein
MLEESGTIGDKNSSQNKEKDFLALLNNKNPNPN